MTNNRVGAHPGVMVRLVKVRIVVDDINAGVRTIAWTVRNLQVGQSESYVLFVNNALEDGEERQLVPLRLYAEIIETEPVEPPGYQFNNSADYWFMAVPRTSDWIIRETNGDAGVALDIPDRFPQAGDTTTFTVKATNTNRGDISGGGNNHAQLDVQVRISLTPGLSFAATQELPTDTTFDTNSGLWDVGTMEYVHRLGRTELDFPVSVNLTPDSLADLPLTQRCLTAEVVRAVPWFEFDSSKRDNDIRTVCLGQVPKLLVTGGHFVLFDNFPCVGVTNDPCTTDDTLELLATTTGGGSNFRLYGYGSADQREVLTSYLQPEEFSIQVWDRRDLAQGSIWSTISSFEITGSYERLPDSVWSATRQDFAATGPDGGDLPGSLAIRFLDDNSEYVTLTDTTKVIGDSFDDTEYDYDIFLDFSSLGTYVLTMDIRGTHKTAGSMNSPKQFTDSATYTFHVGPVAELGVRDAGANPEVASSQRAYTVVAVNNGPQAAAGVQVTLTGVPEGAEAVPSEGSYTHTQGTCQSGTCDGIWDIGEILISDQRRASGLPPHPTLTLVTASGGDPITATIESTEDHEEVINGATQSGPYHDYDVSNNTATVQARAGTATGEGAPGAPRSLSVQRHGGIAVLSWGEVARLHGHPVTHYHVERDGTIVARDVMDDVYVDLDVDVNQPHHSYRVRAVNQFGVPGPWSLAAGGAAEGPGKPTGFTATASYVVGRINLSWFAPSADTGLRYRIEHSADGSTWTILEGSYSGTTYAHDGLSPGTIHYYRVATVKDRVTSDYATDNATAKTEPGAPQSLTATPGYGVHRIELSWLAPFSQSGLRYRIEHATDRAGPWSLLSGSHVGLAYSHLALSPGTTHYYRVATINDGVTSAWATAEASTKTEPGAPQGLTAAASSVMGRINLSWFAPSAYDGLRYRIEHATSGSGPWRVLSASQSGLTYAHSGLPAATTHYYRVATLKDDATSPWSRAQATTKAETGAPTGLTATAGYGVGRIDLAWFPPSADGSLRYRIEQATSRTGPWRLLSSSHQFLTYSDHGLSPGVTYYYRVAALWDGVVSAWAFVQETTHAQPVLDEQGNTVNVVHMVPLWPENLRFSSVDRTSVTLVWDPPANDGGTPVTGYEYRVFGPCTSGADAICDIVAPTRVIGTSVRVSGLNREGDYQFEVRALNAAGAGDWSQSIQKAVGPATAGGGRVILSPSRLTVPEGGQATYRVKLSRSPTQPVWVILHWDGDYDLGGELPFQQFQTLLPSGYDTSGIPDDPCPNDVPRYDWDTMAHAWNVGIPITVTAAEDDDSENGRMTIQHSIYTVPAACLGNPEGYAYDPVYDDMFGIALEVTERDND